MIGKDNRNRFGNMPTDIELTPDMHLDIYWKRPNDARSKQYPDMQGSSIIKQKKLVIKDLIIDIATMYQR